MLRLASPPWRVLHSVTLRSGLRTAGTGGGPSEAAPGGDGAAPSLFGRLMRVVFAVVALLLAGVLAPVLAGAPPTRMFTSLETPPSAAEVATALAIGIRTFELDLDTPEAAAAVAAIKAGNGRVTAYHVGGGGGRAWGSVKTGEYVRKYDDPADFQALTVDVRRLVSLGADLIHFDNTHRFSGKRLEAIVDAIRAGGAGFVAKNNPGKWRLVLQRRPDLRPAYAVVEDAMLDRDSTQAAYDLHDMGVSVLIVGFRKPIDASTPGITDAYAAAYKAVNPWASVLLMEDETRYDSRTGRFF